MTNRYLTWTGTVPGEQRGNADAKRLRDRRGMADQGHEITPARAFTRITAKPVSAFTCSTVSASVSKGVGAGAG